jgi:hypothetical protein
LPRLRRRLRNVEVQTQAGNARNDGSEGPPTRFIAMPTINLTDAEIAAVTALIRRAIAEDK